MGEIIEKASATEIKIITTEERVVPIDQLKNARDSAQQQIATQEAQKAEVIASSDQQIAYLQGIVDDCDTKLARAEQLGVKSADAAVEIAAEV
jgi:hypothetical protein